MAVVIVFALGHVPLLRVIGSFLIVEDPLQPAVAIVPLGGQTPFREMEAAELHHAGWAPVVIIVRGATSAEWETLQQLGIKKAQEWELSRAVLIQQGVSPSAIIVPRDEAAGTLEELRAAYDVLGVKDAPVILVTSKFHTRRARLIWNYVSEGRSRAIVRAARRDPFDPTRWWRERQFILSVVREYLGLINYYAGFPVGAGGG